MKSSFCLKIKLSPIKKKFKREMNTSRIYIKQSVEDWFTKHSKSVIMDSSSVTFSTSMRSSYSQAKFEVGEKLYYSLN